MEGKGARGMEREGGEREGKGGTGGGERRKKRDERGMVEIGMEWRLRDTSRRDIK